MIFASLMLLSINNSFVSLVVWFPFIITTFFVINTYSYFKKIISEKGSGSFLVKNINIPTIFMILGVLMLIFAFIAPFVVGEEFGLHLGNTATPFSSAAAFLLLISANILQQRELSLQRDELTATKEVFMEQSKTMSRQRFENTFFNMLSLNNEIVSSISVQFNGEYRKGRAGFFTLYHRFRSEYNRPTPGLRERLNVVGSEKERLKLIYEKFFYDNEEHLAHYFRNLFRIVKWIDDSDLSYNEKKGYLGILRAQLSSYELQLLFYNCINDIGKDFKKLIIKFDVFDNHIGPEDLVDGSHFDLLKK